MKIKDLIKKLEYFDSEDEIGVYAHDKDNNSMLMIRTII